MSGWKDQLDFDPSSIADSDTVGSYIIGSDGATVVDTVTIATVDRLAVDTTLNDGAGNDITSTGGSLDVNVTNSLGIDVDLDHTEDSVRLGDGTSFFTSTSENGDIALDVHISNTEIAVTQGSDSPWSIDDGGGSITVDATDLDIRSLDHTSGGANDSVRLGDGTDLITSTLVGSDQGLDVNVINNPGFANTDAAHGATSVDDTVGGTNLITTALSDRKRVLFYNNGNSRAFIGKTGVTTANGFPIGRFAGLELEAGPAIDFYAITDTGGSADFRYLELS